MTLFQNEDTFKDGNEYACRIIGAGIQESPSVGTFCIVVWLLHHATNVLQIPFVNFFARYTQWVMKKYQHTKQRPLLSL